MKKVIIIENNTKWFELLSGICKTLNISYFPNSEDTFNRMRSDLSVSLKHNEVVEDHRAKREKELLTYLKNFIGEEKDEDVLYLIDNDLFEKKEDVNGMRFYELHLNGKPALFLPEYHWYRYYKKDLECIKYLCTLHPASGCIEKPEDLFGGLDNKDNEIAEITTTIAQKIEMFISR